MFSNLASYLMGGSTTVPSANVAPPPSELAQGRVIGHQDLSCTEDEDWLLVDPDAEPTAQGIHPGHRTGSVPINIRNRDSSDDPTIADDPSRRDDNQSEEVDEEDSENCMPPTGLEESWYVAPTACIARSRSMKLASSPLENLLIEHPSMSVYHHSTDGSGLNLVSPSSTISEEDAEDDMDIDVSKKHKCRSRSRSAAHLKSISPCGKHTRDLTTASPTVPHLRVQKTSIEDVMFGSRLSKKKEQATRNQLDRLNKSKNIPGNHKLRRKDRQHPTKNSNVNNDRKCFQRPAF